MIIMTVQPVYVCVGGHTSIVMYNRVRAHSCVIMISQYLPLFKVYLYLQLWPMGLV